MANNNLEHEAGLDQGFSDLNIFDQNKNSNYFTPTALRRIVRNHALLGLNIARLPWVEEDEEQKFNKIELLVVTFLSKWRDNLWPSGYFLSQKRERHVISTLTTYFLHLVALPFDVPTLDVLDLGEEELRRWSAPGAPEVQNYEWFQRRVTGEVLRRTQSAPGPLASGRLIRDPVARRLEAMTLEDEFWSEAGESEGETDDAGEENENDEQAELEPGPGEYPCVLDDDAGVKCGKTFDSTNDLTVHYEKEHRL